MVTQTPTLGEGTGSVGKRPDALALGQLAMLVVLGVIFWFVAAMAVLFGSSAGVFGPTASVLTFVLVVPICWLSVLFVKKVARLEAGQTVPGIAVGVVAATLCDGIALTWGRQLYGTDPAQITLGAAWILWGVGLFLLFAYLTDQRQVIAAR
ncbi:MAG: hypothetical protein H7Z42_11475 [Roseiflexaceae bacterium]|nr:hypothetical protein [Roseiflexaceae bacterium]